MAMALSLPLDFPDREAVINLTFGVVLFTLLVPGLTMGTLVRLLGMMTKDQELKDYQKCQSLLSVYKAESKRIEEMRAGGQISSEIYEVLNEKNKVRTVQTEAELTTVSLTATTIQDLHLRQTQLELAKFRKEKLAQLVKEGKLSEDALHEIRVEVDAEIESLEAGSNSHNQPPSVDG